MRNILISFSLNATTYFVCHTAGDRHDRHKMEKHFFATYTVQELQWLGYWDYAEARQNNLTYPVHPILDRSRWDSPDNLYNAIIHILRLASAMLQSPASVAFHHAVMYGAREYLPEPSKRHGLSMLQVPPHYRRLSNHLEVLRVESVKDCSTYPHSLVQTNRPRNHPSESLRSHTAKPQLTYLPKGSPANRKWV